MTSLDEIRLTPHRKEICERIGLKTAEDIITFFPTRYEEINISSYDNYTVGKRITFIGTIIGKPTMAYTKTKRSLVRFKCTNDYAGEMFCTIFNRPWAINLTEGTRALVIGTFEGNNRVTVYNYYLGAQIEKNLGVRPVYLQRDGISQAEIRAIVNFTLKKMTARLPDILPKRLINDHGLISYEEAVYEIHNPTSNDLFKQALSRLKYEELLHFYLALYMRQTPSAQKQHKHFDMEKVKCFMNDLPFALTVDQTSTIEEIISDISSDKVMARLVQGDVGCGKTIVATIALYANYLAGYQGAFMAPTEILARQHYRDVSALLEELGVRVCLLSAATKNKEVLEDLANHSYDIVIGTHALFSDDVKMAKLGLVITDEQQRFGVRQRRKLLDKGENVDFLLMSATPIPRTLATAIYGDLAISSIRTMPEGRKGCDTYVIRTDEIEPILPELLDLLNEGRQIYIVAAAIEPSEVSNDVITLHEQLSAVFRPFKTGLLHGKLSVQERDEVMNDFATNEIQVLVTTTVVEVGVNVKNATAMVVYDAERFGLSQLHQLRGRIQRGSYRGRCYLLTSSTSEEIAERLAILVKSNDGFVIADEDLRLRGMGDLLGTRQSGLPQFMFADILNDRRFIEAAQRDARYILDHRNDEENHLILKRAQEVEDIA